MATSGRPARHIGTSAPSPSPSSANASSEIARFQTSLSPRSVAAASLEPPPMPDATGRFFSSRIDTGGQADEGAAARSLSRAAMTRLPPSSGIAAAPGPVTAKRSDGAGSIAMRSPKRVKTLRLSIRW